MAGGLENAAVLALTNGAPVAPFEFENQKYWVKRLSGSKKK